MCSGGAPPCPVVFGRLLALFLIVPVVDLAVLVAVGDRIGLGTTVVIVVLTAVVGSWLAKREGLAAWQRVRSQMASGGLPGDDLVDGLIILVAGTLLLTPGFLTDIVGILGLLPPSRAGIRRLVRARFERALREGTVRAVGGGFGVGGPAGAGPFRARPPVEDAEVVEERSPDGGAPPQAE